MPTYEQLADSYLDQLKSASDRRLMAGQIVKKIQGLVYSDSNEPLSLADRQRILNLMRDRVQTGVVVKEADNASYLALLNHMFQLLEG